MYPVYAASGAAGYLWGPSSAMVRRCCLESLNHLEGTRAHPATYPSTSLEGGISSV